MSRIANLLAVQEQDVVSMNRRLAAADHSLNAPMNADGEGEWQDWLVDEAESQESSIGDREELSGRRALLANALNTLNPRERHILEERRLKDTPTTLGGYCRSGPASRASVFGRSRCGRLSGCRGRCGLKSPVGESQAAVTQDLDVAAQRHAA